MENTFIPLVERKRPTLTAALLLLMLATAGLWISSFAAELLPPAKGIAGELVIDALYYVPFALLPTILYMLRRGGLSDGLRLNPMPLLPTLSIILLAILCVYAASALDSLWVMLLGAIGLHKPQSAVGAAASSSALTMEIIGSAAIPAICEELLFRGTLFSALERRGTWAALWLSSALFALMHGNLFGLPAYFAVGAISAFVVYTMDSIYAGMLFHTTYNAAILVIIYVAASQPEIAAEAYISPTGLMLDFMMVGLMIAATLMTLNLRRRAWGIEPVPRNPEPLKTSERLLLIGTVLLLIADTAVIQILTEAGL